MSFFFFNDPATTEIYTYVHNRALHDALPIFPVEEGLLPLLCRAEAVCGEPPQLSSAGSHAPIYEFWPTLSERCVRGEIEFACHPCEPDLLIKQIGRAHV